MKGFPNQVADLGKLATAMRCVVRLVDQREQVKDDGVFGEELVRAGIAGTGHTPMPIDDYLRLQRLKSPSNQSFRTTARGLRELFRLLGFIDDSRDAVIVTNLGRQAAAYADTPLNEQQIDFWRRAIQSLVHCDQNGECSHPYQVLLRLVGRKPGITRAKCALALEALNDSPEQLNRIADLADLEEDEIRQRIGETESNWDNAKKVLPRFAEQLGDVVVVKRGRDQLYYLADSPGRADVGIDNAVRPAEERRQTVPRAPRTARQVTPETIAQAGVAERFDQDDLTPNLDPLQAAEAIRTRADRLRRHNLIVRQLAETLAASRARLYENPFDILAIFGDQGVLIEVKTLDGTPEDERDRVREALSQLLYYEAFLTPPDALETIVHKVACFEAKITDAHIEWLNTHRIRVIWREGDGFDGQWTP
jgi:hypothetical protein